jgi:hypothetical protein
VATAAAAEAYEQVLAGAGATLPARDAVDQRIVEGCRAGKGALIDSQRDVGGWPKYATSAAPADADNDGMPDAWERAHGLNPRDPADAAAVAPGGYTNLERWIHSLSPPAKAARMARP